MFGIFGVFVQAACAQVLYLALRLESGSFPQPLRPAEEQAAFAALQAGDAAARDRLISHNLRLVAHVVKKYYAAAGSTDDLISIGTVGLIKAVDTFRPERRVRFASYASQCIENEIRMHLRHIRREGTVVSLQEPLEASTREGGTLTLGDVLPDEAVMEDDCEQRDLARRLRVLVAELPERERRILTLRYGLDRQPPLTQQQVADSMGVLQSAVSNWESEVALPRARQLPLLARVLGCSIDELFAQEPEAAS